MNTGPAQPRVPIQIRVEPSLHAWLAATAHAEGTTMSALILAAIDEYRARRGVCAVCGEAMELTVEDRADPQGAVCVECAG